MNHTHEPIHARRERLDWAENQGLQPCWFEQLVLYGGWTIYLAALIWSVTR